jgi:hypothetical protein
MLYYPLKLTPTPFFGNIESFLSKTETAVLMLRHFQADKRSVIRA